MASLRDDLKAVAAIAVLALLTLITITLAGVFNGLTEAQSAFLGTLSGAFIGFISLLAGALYNARLTQRLTLEDEAKKARSAMMLLHARVRSFAVTVGLIARTVEHSKHVTVDVVESFELASGSVSSAEIPDVRLIDPGVLTALHDFNAHTDGTRFTVVAPVKLCRVSEGVFEVSEEFVEHFRVGMANLCDDAIGLRKMMSKVLSVTDVGPSSFADMSPDSFSTVTK